MCEGWGVKAEKGRRTLVFELAAQHSPATLSHICCHVLLVDLPLLPTLPVQADRYAAGVARFDFDRALAPYDLQRYSQWAALSCHISSAVLQQLLVRVLLVLLYKITLRCRLYSPSISQCDCQFADRVSLLSLPLLFPLFPCSQLPPNCPPPHPQHLPPPPCAPHSPQVVAGTSASCVRRLTPGS